MDRTIASNITGYLAPRTFAGRCSENRYLLCVGDVLAVTVAWFAAIDLRFFLNRFMTLQLDVETLLKIAPPLYMVLGLWIAAAWWLHIYRETPSPRRGASLVRVLESGTVCGAVIIVAAFFSREMGADLSRSFVLLFVPVCFFSLWAFRVATMLCALFAQRYWPMAERVAVVANEEHGDAFIERIRDFGACKLAGRIVPGPEVGRAAAAGVLGPTAKLGELINTARLNRIILLEQGLSEEDRQHCLSISRRMRVTVTRIIGVSDPGARPRISEEFGLRLLETTPVSFTHTQDVIKRCCDMTLSVALLALLSPVLLAIALVVKTTSRGPVFYCSRRVGRGGRHFTFLKFRTMYVGREDRRGLTAQNEKTGHVFKMRNDPRLTPAGKFLRRWSVDELPQLINVLFGHMSMVGPRPLPAGDLDPDGNSQEFAFWAEQRSRVLPGITGLWQIRGRSDLPFEKMVELDVEYIRQWSIALDLRILLETPLVVLTGRGAY